MRDSRRGVSEPTKVEADELVARLLRNAERAREQPQSSETHPRRSADGEAWEIERRLRSARVPDNYRQATWDRVRSRAVRAWCEDLPERLRRPGHFEPTAVDWSKLGHGLLIVGPTGTGKSSAAALAAREVVRIDRNVLWSYVPDLLDRMAMSARERAGEVRMQSGVDLLVWDDFGVRSPAEWEVGFMDQIVEARYQSRRPMIVTTNLTPQDIAADDRLTRIVDRWRDYTAKGVIVLSGESMRGGAR